MSTEAAAPPLPNPVIPPHLSFADAVGDRVEAQENAASAAPVTEPAKEPVTEPVVPQAVEPAKEPVTEPADPLKAIEVPETKDPAAAKPAAEEFPEKPPGKVTEAASKAWAAMRGELKTSNTKLKEFEAQIAERETKLADLTTKLAEFENKTAVSKDEWETLQKESQNLQTVVKLTKLEASPEYKKTITEPMTKVAQAVDNLATKHGFDAKKLMTAFLDPDVDARANVIGEVIEGMNFLEQKKVADLVGVVEQVEAKRAELQSDVEKSLQLINDRQTKAQEASQAQSVQALEEGIKAARKTLGEKLWLMQKREGDDWKDWNSSIDEVDASVQRIMTAKNITPEQHAHIVFNAVLLPRTIETLKQSHAENTELRAALAKYQKATPGAGSGGGNAAAPPVSKAETGMGFVEAILAGQK